MDSNEWWARVFVRPREVLWDWLVKFIQDRLDVTIREDDHPRAWDAVTGRAGGVYFSANPYLGTPPSTIDVWHGQYHLGEVAPEDLSCKWLSDRLAHGKPRGE